MVHPKGELNSDSRHQSRASLPKLTHATLRSESGFESLFEVFGKAQSQLHDRQSRISVATGRKNA